MMRRVSWQTVTLAMAAALILGGCGGGGGDTTDSVETTTCELTVESRDTLRPYDDNPYYDQQWYFHYDADFYASVGLNYRCNPDPDAHIHPWPNQDYTGRGIRVAVIDDALDIRHEDLKGAIVRVYDVETKSENVCPRSDDENHGTEVTGLLAASSNDKGISGISPEVSILFVRLPFPNVYESDIVEAFEKVKEWGADVVNCSWGSGDVGDAVRDAIVDLAENGRDGKGTVIVFAAGNGGSDQIGDPIGNDESGIEQVIAVGASNIENKRTRYSNYGPELDIMAPGGEYVGLTTLDQMGEAGMAPGTSNYLFYNDTYAFAGTSASAPIVAAVVAQMLQADPTLTRTDVYDYLTRNAEKFDDADCNYDTTTGFSEYCGYGKVDVETTLNDILH